MDTESVPAEHSQNCIHAAKFLNPIHADQERSSELFWHCREADTEACERYFSSMNDSRAIYWRSIAKSIAKFGLPDDQFKGDGGHLFFRFYDRMQPHFERCLEKHPDPEKPAWMNDNEVRVETEEVPVPQMAPPVRQNEHCISLEEYNL
ncbi:MAG: hypothetical protein ABJP34_08170 [Erythrobacter sp.]